MVVLKNNFVKPNDVFSNRLVCVNVIKSFSEYALNCKNDLTVLIVAQGSCRIDNKYTEKFNATALSFGEHVNITNLDNAVLYELCYSGYASRELAKNKNIFPFDSCNIIQTGLFKLVEPKLSSSLSSDMANAYGYMVLATLLESREMSKKHYPTLVNHAISIMQNDFCTLYGVEELAQRLSVTKHHLIRVFSSCVGMPPLQYITSLRIERTKDLLVSSSKSISEIAKEVGFSCSDYFCKVFKQRTGITPSEYRKQNYEYVS